MTVTLHENEIPIDIALVRRLVDDQFTDYQHLALTPMQDSGSSNRLFRLGDELLVRLPRQPGGSAAIDKEDAMVASIRDALPVDVPRVIHVGAPGSGYPERWSIVQWIDGDILSAYTPEATDTHGREALARDLAEVVVSLQSIEIPEAARKDETLRWYRGRPLTEFDRYARKTIDLCRKIPDLHLNLDHVQAIWENSLELPGATEAMSDHWYHADLVCENLLTRHHRLAAVLDFGSLSIGDPTIDLHGGWELFDPTAREVFRIQTGASDAQWLRGRAWALAIALGVFTYYWGKMPRRQHDRLAMANAVIADVAEHDPSWLK